MHELEIRIAQWRQDLARTSSLEATVLDELESHLRDEIDQQTRKGVAPDEGFATAIARLGPPEKIAAEFAKLEQPWWPVRVVVAGVCLAVVILLSLIGWFSLNEPQDAWLAIHVLAISAGYLLSYGIGVLALCYGLRRMFKDLSAGQQNFWLRTLRNLSGAALLLTFVGWGAGYVWVSHNLQKPVITDPREIGGLLVLSWQTVMLVSVWQFSWSPRWLISWGLLGNVAVTFAWFVAAHLAQNDGALHSYGGASAITIFGAFELIILLHVFILAGTIAPSGWLRRRAA